MTPFSWKRGLARFAYVSIGPGSEFPFEIGDDEPWQVDRFSSRIRHPRTIGDPGRNPKPKWQIPQTKAPNGP
jgi:hypothetical protein